MRFGYILWIFAVASSLAGVQFVCMCRTTTGNDERASLRLFLLGSSFLLVASLLTKTYLYPCLLVLTFVDLATADSIQFAAGLPLFHERFFMDTSTANIILATSGPIAGFFVQPITGVFSDNATNKYGRRRPFILVGTLLTALGMAMLGSSERLGNLMGDNPSGVTSADHKVGLAIGIIGLWIMNIFTNMMQGPSRALLNDVVDPDYLQVANAIASAVMALAAIVGSVIGANTTTLDQPYFVLLLAGAGCILMVCVPTLIAGREKPHVPKEGEPKKGVLNIFADIYKGFRYMPRDLGFIALLYFLSWCAYSPLLYNQSTYIQQILFPGDPTFGLSIGFYAAAIAAGVQFVYSLLQPALLRVINAKVIYIATQVLATLSYLSVLFLWPNPAAAIALICVAAMNFSAFNSIPFAIVATITAGANGGLYLGVLNSAAVVSQAIAVNGVAVPIISATTAANSTITLVPSESTPPVMAVGWGIASGAIWSVIAIIWAFFAIKIKEEPAPGEDKPLIQNAE